MENKQIVSVDNMIIYLENSEMEIWIIKCIINCMEDDHSITITFHTKQ